MSRCKGLVLQNQDWWTPTGSDQNLDHSQEHGTIITFTVFSIAIHVLCDERISIYMLKVNLFFSADCLACVIFKAFSFLESNESRRRCESENHASWWCWSLSPKKNTNEFLKLEKEIQSHVIMSICLTRYPVYEKSIRRSQQFTTAKLLNTPFLSGLEEKIKKKKKNLPQILRWRIKLPWHIHYIWPLSSFSCTHGFILPGSSNLCWASSQ